MIMTVVKEIILNDGNRIPEIGFGTYKATNGDGYKVVLDAIRAGYRLLDSAKVYENEEDVGRAIKESNIPREEFFITSKLDRNMMGYDTTRSEFENTLKRLGMDSIYCTGQERIMEAQNLMIGDVWILRAGER